MLFCQLDQLQRKIGIASLTTGNQFQQQQLFVGSFAARQVQGSPSAVRTVTAKDIAEMIGLWEHDPNRARRAVNVHSLRLSRPSALRQGWG